MQSKATTVAEYLAELPADRRAAIESVRKVVNENLPKGFVEGIQYGMICWSVPHSIYPAGYHCDPKQALPYTALASQKNYMSFYLSCLYSGTKDDAWFQAQWAKTGKKLDMGKSCIRFKKVDELALEVIAKAVARVSMADYIKNYEDATCEQREKKRRK